MKYTHKLNLSGLNKEDKSTLLKTFGYDETWNLIYDKSIRELYVDLRKNRNRDINDYVAYIIRDSNTFESFQYRYYVNSSVLTRYMKYLKLGINIEEFLSHDTSD